MVSNEAEGACAERKSQSSQVASDRQFVEHLDYATSIVSRWPAWKRNILQHSYEPTNSVRREPFPARAIEGD